MGPIVVRGWLTLGSARPSTVPPALIYEQIEAVGIPFGCISTFSTVMKQIGPLHDPWRKYAEFNKTTATANNEPSRLSRYYGREMCDSSENLRLEDKRALCVPAFRL